MPEMQIALCSPVPIGNQQRQTRANEQHNAYRFAIVHKMVDGVNQVCFEKSTHGYKINNLLKEIYYP
jgi:hypothetical protein